jgi:hypothetical protein
MHICLHIYISAKWKSHYIIYTRTGLTNTSWLTFLHPSNKRRSKLLARRCKSACAVETENTECRGCKSKLHFYVMWMLMWISKKKERLDFGSAVWVWMQLLLCCCWLWVVSFGVWCLAMGDGSVSRYRIVGTNRQGFLLCCVLVGEVEDGCCNERLFAGFDSVTYFSTMMDTLIGKIYS